MAGWDDMVSVHEGDCLAVMRMFADCSVDAVVTDPPYELGFMGKKWDTTGVANNPALWSEVIRVLKPGGHVATFSGTRTYHRLACAIEDAGFEIRDQLAWCYGSGFPKSHDVSKGIDKAAGAEREVVGKGINYDAKVRHAATHAPDGGITYFSAPAGPVITAPATPEAAQWSGWGTALKPAWEPICLARKPLSEPTVAANVLRWGTGAINVDATRIGTGDDLNGGAYRGQTVTDGASGSMAGPLRNSIGEFHPPKGRWPANLCHDGSQEVLDLFPAPHGAGSSCGNKWARSENVNVYGKANEGTTGARHGDSGSAARFFYHAKASKHDRAGSKHPTVKPVNLMRWLCRLITPPGGLVLDPFAGTGTTGMAAQLEGFRSILIEREAEYIADIARRTVARVLAAPLGGLFAEAQPPAEARI